MIRAIKAVSSERGRDPRDYALVAFGGNGPMFACVMAQSLGIGRVLIPPAAGVFSSYGLLYSDVEYHLTKTRIGLLAGFEPGEIEAELDRARGGRAGAVAAGRVRGRRRSRSPAARCCTTRASPSSWRCRYRRARWTGPRWKRRMGSEHERTYGHRAGSDEPVELVTVKVVGPRRAGDVAGGAGGGRCAAGGRRHRRAACGGRISGRRHGWLETTS